jgi:hypothetical protein
MKFQFDEMVVIGGKGWMAGNTVSGLFCYDLATGKIERRIPFKDEVVYAHEQTVRRTHWYRGIVCVGNCLVLTPCWVGEIAIYDIKRDEMRYCQVPWHEEPEPSFIVCQHENYIYYATATSKCFCRLDVAQNRIQEISIIDRLNLEPCESSGKYWSSRSGCIAGRLYLAMADSNRVVEYDMTADQVQLYSVGEENLYDIKADRDDIWAVTVEGTVLRWNRDMGVKFRYRVTGEDLYPDRRYRLFLQEGCVYVLGVYQNNDVLMISQDDNKITRKKTKLFEREHMEDENRWEANFTFVGCVEKIFAQYKTGEFCLADSLDDSSWKTIEISAGECKDDKNILYIENPTWGLSEFVEMVTS